MSKNLNKIKKLTAPIKKVSLIYNGLSGKLSDNRELIHFKDAAALIN